MKIKLYTVKAVLTVCENFITHVRRFGCGRRDPLITFCCYAF